MTVHAQCALHTVCVQNNKICWVQQGKICCQKSILVWCSSVLVIIGSLSRTKYFRSVSVTAVHSKPELRKFNPMLNIEGLYLFKISITWPNICFVPACGCSSFNEAAPQLDEQIRHFTVNCVQISIGIVYWIPPGEECYQTEFLGLWQKIHMR